MTEQRPGANGSVGRVLEQVKEQIREIVVRGVGPLQKRIDGVDQRVADLERRVEELERGNKTEQGG